MNNYLANLSPEERAINLAKARVARKEQATLREANKHLLKLHYEDAGWWDDLARKYKVKRMPSKEEAADTSTIHKYLKRVGVSREEWDSRYTSAPFFVKHNPKWTKYAVVGLILEIKEELHG